MTPDANSSLALGRYRVVHELARGGMGIVYLGRVEGAAGFTRPVVIKRVLGHMAEDAEALGFFAREARILSQLHHPNIVNVVDFGEDGSEYIMVLEYVRGYHLGQWHTYLNRSQRTLPAELSLLVIGRILDALEYAHTFRQPDGSPTPIIHRDISPGNVLLDTQGHVKLLDFGIARIEGTGEHRTREGTFKGKLPFSAPELFHGQSPSVKTDLYSCGVLLYMLLTNVNPFRGKTRKDTLYRVLNHTPPPVSSLRDDASEGLDEVVARALARDPANRFATAGEFAAALRGLQTRSSEELQAELAAMLEADFLGEMPAALHLERLQDLDEAWRHPDSSGSSNAIDTDVTETIAAERDSLTHPTSGATRDAPRTERPGGRRAAAMWGAVVGGVATLGALALAAWRFMPSRDQPEAKVIVIEKESGQASGTPPAGAGRAPAPAATSPPEPAATPHQPAPPSAPGPAASPPTSPSSASNPAVLLSRRFQSNQPKVQSCFSTHADDIEGSPQVMLRFHVRSDGSVKSATLSPAALATTALGNCLLGVARSARFGTQPEPITFSIPITARRLR